MTNKIKQLIEESIEVKHRIANDDALMKKTEEAAHKMIETIRQNGKLLICGNGGSASDAMHFAGELIGRFQKEREAIPAIALPGDVTSITSIANDYGYENVFSRQVEGFGRKGDVLVGISTSGQSENVYRAVKAAKELGIYTVGLLGKDGGKIADQTDLSLIVPCDVTARIQESHILIIHILCEMIEQNV